MKGGKGEEYIDENIERVKLNKELYRKRQEIVEHPFGTIKRQWGYDYVLMKGLGKVSGEFAIIFTTYNLRRAISIFGVNALVNKLREASFLFFRDIRGILKRYKPIFFGNKINMRLNIENKYRLKMAYFN